MPALVAVGGIAAAPASAIELGEIRIDSTLGQPLRASIAYALHASEQIHDYCVFLQPVRNASGIPGVGKPRIAITDSAILLRGRTPLREPLVAMQLSVQCHNTANLAREYTLMIDLPSPASGVGVGVADGTEGVPLTRVVAPPARTQNVVAKPESTPVVAHETTAVPVTTSKAPPIDKSPIATGIRYQVQAGDSLSQIVSRIEDRSIALWPAVDAVFAANPHAFLNQDRDLLRAGAWLVIPDLTGASAVGANAGVSGEPVDTAATASATPAAAAAVPVEVEADDVSSLPATTTVAVDIPQTAVEITQVAPLIPASQNTDTSTTGSWLRWLGGAGLTLLLTALIFGRQIRDRFASVAIGGAAARPRRRKQEVAARPDTSGAGVEGYDVSVSAELFDHVAKDDDATVQELQTIGVEEAGNSRFALISDFERQVFQQNFNAAIAAAGHASTGVPEIAQDADAEGNEVDCRKSRAS